MLSGLPSLARQTDRQTYRQTNIQTDNDDYSAKNNKTEEKLWKTQKK
jgi:hypothetical protein